MAKNSIDDWDETAGSNLDIGGINIAENCPAANINNAIREMMSQLAVFYAARGTASDGDIGVEVQAYDAGLADIAAITPTDSLILVGNGTTWVGESGSVARTSLGIPVLIDDATFATATASNTASAESIKAYVDDRWRWYESSVVNLSGSEAVTITGIPSWASDIELVLIRASTATAVDMLVRVQVSGADVTSGYYSQSASNSSSSGVSTGMVVEFSGVSALDASGSMAFRKLPGLNEWTASHAIGFAAGGGDVDAGGAIDGLTVIASGTTFDNGRAYIRWRR